MKTDIGVILELERVRDWAKGQTQIGSEAPASWDQYVTLIESADAILHEIAVAGNLPAQRNGRPQLAGLSDPPMAAYYPFALPAKFP